MVFLFPPPQGHSSFVTHVDWSQDSQYLVTNSGDYEILFCRSSALHLHFESLQIITEDNETCCCFVDFRGGILWQTRDQHGHNAQHGMGHVHLHPELQHFRWV